MIGEKWRKRKKKSMKEEDGKERMRMSYKKEKDGKEIRS